MTWQTLCTYSTTYLSLVSNKCRLTSVSWVTVRVIIFRPDEHPCNVLSRSAAFSKLKCDWEVEKSDEDTKFSCRVLIDGRKVASVDDVVGKVEAKKVAAEKAVESLSALCYSLRMKQKFVNDKIVQSDLNNDENVEGALDGANIGHKLMRLMGWNPGEGLGKGGRGISEPIRASDVSSRGRGGFGSNERNSSVSNRVKKIIEEFARRNDEDENDLVFSSDFDAEQRRLMHAMAQKLGLKSKSFGKGDQRFITISKKLSGKQIVRKLLLNARESEKYVLVPPQSINID